jgi:RNA polymerase sigma factor (sigma-70 family)
LSLAIRTKPPLALEDADAAETIPDSRIDPETAVRIAQLNAILNASLHQLPPEEAAIIRLKYVEGLTNAAIERALGVKGITLTRMQDILVRLRATLERAGIGAPDVALAPGISLDGGGS